MKSKPPHDEPLVSVIMPVHNGGSKFASAVDRVLNDQYRNVEVIAVDDASTDETRTLLRDSPRRHERLSTVLLNVNGGPGVARNEGLRLATGKYVWFVDWDDNWEDSFLTRLVAAAEKHGADVATTRAAWRNGDGEFLGVTDGMTAETLCSGALAFDLLMAGHFKGYLWNKLFRRSSIPTDPFPPIYTQEDLYMVSTVFSRAQRVVSLPDVLYSHLIRPGSITNSTDPDLTTLAIARDQVNSSAHSLGITPARRRLLEHFDYAFWHVATAITAIRLSDGSTRDVAVSAARRRMTYAGAARTACLSPGIGLKSAVLLVVGGRYAAIRRAGLRARLIKRTVFRRLKLGTR